MSVATSVSKRTIKINNGSKTVDLSGGVVYFKYYESLLSPYVSAGFEYVDTGNTVRADSKDDGPTRMGTLINALPLRGNEDVTFTFDSFLGKLDFARNPLSVDGATVLGQEANRESASIRLISRLYKKNQDTRVEEKYYGNISDSVQKILFNKLGLASDKIDVDPTKIPWNFTGSNQKPFDLLLDMASVSTPPKGDPGYFFYETKSGVHFKSIDNLVAQEPKLTYTYDGVFRSDLEDGSNRYDILEQPNKKDQSISSSLRAGMYSAKFRFMYEDLQECREKIYRLDDKKESTLGRKVEFDPELKESPSRTYTLLIPTGMMDNKIGNNVNNDPADFLARSVMRYNLLFVQAMNIVVPCNPELEAGDVIRCNFEKITSEDKRLGPIDTNESGNYLIMNLCHYYDTTNSYTYLTLVRDTYGLKGAIA